MIYLRRHYTIPLPDAIIVATAIETGSSLVTRNTADFGKILHLELIDPFQQG